METQLQHLYNLLKSDNSYKDVLAAVDNLQNMDKFLLENFSPSLVGLYARMDNISDISDIYNLIPYDHKIIDKLPDENRIAILRIINEYQPNVSVYPEIKKPDLNVLQRVIELRKDFNRPYERRKFPFENAFEIRDGFPHVYNSRRFALAEFFDLDFRKVHVSKQPNQMSRRYSKLMEEIFANTMLKRFDIYGFDAGVNVYIRDFMELFNRNNIEPGDFIAPMKELKGFLRDHQMLDSDMYKFLGLIKDTLQAPSMDQHLLQNGYEDLRSLMDGSCCKNNTMVSNNCRDRKIAYHYVDQELRPLLAKLVPFKIPQNHSTTVHLFLDAFPYHHNNYCYIDFDGTNEIVKFEPKKIQNLQMSSETKRKFTELLHLTNLNLPYQVLYDLTKTVNFTVNECVSLFKYVMDFQNYICAFLASLVCQHNVNIFDIVNTKLQYQLVKCLPQEYHISMQTDICKYAYTDSRLISLHSIYQTFNVDFQLANYGQFVKTVEHLKLISRNKAQLYMTCSQVAYNEFYVYEYLRNNPTIDAITSLILARILLGNPQISDAEKNVLHYHCNSTYLTSPPKEKLIGFPDKVTLNKRGFTPYDTMSLEEYFGNWNNDSDIPLIVEEVPIRQVEAYLGVGDTDMYTAYSNNQHRRVEA